MYNVLDICRYIINYSNEHDYSISNLKLQKLLYFVQAYFLISTNDHEPCFVEPIEAWDFGPVVPVAYREYKHYGSGSIPPITSYLEFDLDDIWDVCRIDYDDSMISKNDKELINEVVDEFSGYTATDLVTLTHRQAPWKNAYEPYMNNEIKIDAIREYFNG